MCAGGRIGVTDMHILGVNTIASFVSTSHQHSRIYTVCNLLYACAAVCTSHLYSLIYRTVRNLLYTHAAVCTQVGLPEWEWGLMDGGQLLRTMEAALPFEGRFDLYAPLRNLLHQTFTYAIWLRARNRRYTHEYDIRTPFLQLYDTQCLYVTYLTGRSVCI